jgi:hypothetical protein
MTDIFIPIRSNTRTYSFEAKPLLSFELLKFGQTCTNANLCPAAKVNQCG